MLLIPALPNERSSHSVSQWYLGRSRVLYSPKVVTLVSLRFTARKVWSYTSKWPPDNATRRERTPRRVPCRRRWDGWDVDQTSGIEPPAMAMVTEEGVYSCVYSSQSVARLSVHKPYYRSREPLDKGWLTAYDSRPCSHGRLCRFTSFGGR